MITKHRRLKMYCRENIENVKNYNLAVNDTENIWHMHHINELTFTREELIKMNMYFHRPADEFIFLTAEEHRKFHRENNRSETVRRNKISISQTGKTKTVRTDFGIKFFNHYGMHSNENYSLYRVEYNYYLRHNKKCRWEV